MFHFISLLSSSFLHVTFGEMCPDKKASVKLSSTNQIIQYLVVGLNSFQTVLQLLFGRIGSINIAQKCLWNCEAYHFLFIFICSVKMYASLVSSNACNIFRAMS